MVLTHPSLRAVFYSIGGFAMWVVADTCMKLAGEADLPPYEIVGFLGFFGASAMSIFYGSKGRIRELWPKKPALQAGRVMMTFGCVIANAIALKHLPLTLFYIVIFTCPMAIAVMAGIFLRERLSWPMIAAIIAGFTGVVIAIDPWSAMASGDWVGYIAAGISVLFFAVATVWMRYMTQTESPQSMTFMTGFIESMLGFTLCLWHAVPVPFTILLMLVVMGLFNVTGNLFNSIALRLTDAATVEQFHYSQIVAGALLGYLIWHEMPTQHLIVGALIIIASGLYVAHAHYKSGRAMYDANPPSDSE